MAALACTSDCLVRNQPAAPVYPAPARPAELELTQELEAEENEVFYTDDFAMHDLAAGGWRWLAGDAGHVPVNLCPPNTC